METFVIREAEVKALVLLEIEVKTYIEK